MLIKSDWEESKYHSQLHNLTAYIHCYLGAVWHGSRQLWLPPAISLFIHCSKSRFSLSFLSLSQTVTASGFTGEARNFGSTGSVNSTRYSERRQQERENGSCYSE